MQTTRLFLVNNWSKTLITIAYVLENQSENAQIRASQH